MYKHLPEIIAKNRQDQVFIQGLTLLPSRSSRKKLLKFNGDGSQSGLKAIVKVSSTALKGVLDEDLCSYRMLN
jgi:hypothetical protein